MTIDARELIVDLRGGVPSHCDFCGQETAPEEMHPEEAGDWACEDCLIRWGDIKPAADDA